jgi:hypothetical protein
MLEGGDFGSVKWLMQTSTAWTANIASFRKENTFIQQKTVNAFSINREPAFTQRRLGKGFFIRKANVFIR